MSKLKELREALEALRAKAAKVFEEAGPDLDFAKVKSIEGDDEAKAKQLREWNDEMSPLVDEIKALEEIDAIKARTDELGKVERHPGHSSKGRSEAEGEGDEEGDGEGNVKSLGALFVESDALKGWRRGSMEGPSVQLDLSVNDIKAVFSTTAGWAPFSPRLPKVVDFATRPLAVADLFPMGQTTATSIVYMEETTFTNAAVEIAEGALKPEATLALTERTEAVRKIAVFLPITDEQLEDVPQARSYVENRLGFMVRQRLDSQLLVGDGTAPNLSGILDRAGIQTQAKGVDPTPDAVYKAMTKVRTVAFAEPNAAVFHPNDWQDIRLLRTTDGVYIWGNPSDAGPERIWGLRVAQTTGLTENTGLVGDFNQAELVMRKGLTVQIGFNSDDWTKNKQTVRAELRAAFAVYRPAAFCQITGI